MTRRSVIYSCKQQSSHEPTPLASVLQGYADIGETARALNSIKVGADYITSCSVSDSEFVVQVGNYALDLVDLNSPEDMTQARPVYTVNATSPGKEKNRK